MYKSIFFFQGEFGKQINSLKDINKQFENLDLEVTNTLNDFVVNIIKGINELDDSYFGELENAVYSNDVQSIENALEKGQQLTIVASTLHSNSKEVKETEKSKLLSLAKTYDLSNESQFVSFMEDVNKNTSLNLDLNLIMNNVNDLKGDEAALVPIAYAAAVVSLFALAVTAAAAVNAVVAYAGVLAVEIAYAWTTAKWFGISSSEDKLLYEKLVSDLVMDI